MSATTAPHVGPAIKLSADPEPSLTPRVGILIGYARCSTEKQDLTAQRRILPGWRADRRRAARRLPVDSVAADWTPRRGCD
jgi:hypothetical protein